MMRALITFFVAIGMCALVLMFGPTLAEQASTLLSEPAQSDYAALETVGALVIFGGLLLLSLGGAVVSRVNPLRLGRNPLRSGAMGLAFGLCGLGAAAGYAWVAGAVEPGQFAASSAGLLIWGSALILFMVSVEEVFFRGWVQPVMIERFGVAAGVLMSTLAFAALHLMGGARSPTTLLNLFLGGLLFGLLAARSGGLAGAIGAHFGYNWSEQILLGLDPNPGVGSFGALVDYDLAGSALWGGSDEGLNASLAMTIALLALLVPLLVLARTGGKAAKEPALREPSGGALGT